MPADALAPARLSFDAAGVARADAFDDVYHSRDGGPAQARHVFVHGNRLPQRWRARRSFTVLETGFGLGLNFLSVWEAFRNDPARPQVLHYVAVEKHPPVRADLARAHSRWQEFAGLADELQRRWPPLLRGFHRLEFAAGHIRLSLLFGDAAQMLAELDVRADAIFLDGFAPQKNPAMWSDAVFREIARVSRPGATATSWTVAGSVKAGLRQAGFHVEKQAGFGRKREMLVAVRAGEAAGLDERPASRRHAIVIGAGLAGAWSTHALAARGWHVDLIERHAAPAREASGNAVGAVLPGLNLADGDNARLSRSAFLLAAARLSFDLDPATTPIAAATGVLHVACNSSQAERMARILALHQFPSDYVCWLDAQAAAQRAGRGVAGPGWWIARGGWARPTELCEQLLSAAAAHVTGHFGRAVATISRTADGWRALDAQGIAIAEAPLLLLANAHAASRLDVAGVPPLIPVRGQVTHLPPAPSRHLDAVICGDGYVAPMPGGGYCAGATFEPDSTDLDTRPLEHAENLARVDRMLPGFCTGLNAATLGGRVALRTATADRLPVCGALATADAEPTIGSGLHIIAGLGARGLIWAPLCAEILAARLEHEPMPVERSLADALLPQRLMPRQGTLR